MKSSNLYSQLKTNFKLVSKDMNRAESKRTFKICIYIIFIFDT